MAAAADRSLAALPRGGGLPEATWRSRHRLLQVLLAAHLPILAVLGHTAGEQPGRLAVALLGVAVVGAAGMVAKGRRAQAVAVTVALLLCSTLLVAYSGGRMEAHFHYFVVLAFVALYQDWTAFLVAVGFVVASHGVFGVLAPQAMYANPAAWERPWVWALVHGGALLAAAVAHAISWVSMERREQKVDAYHRELSESEKLLQGRLQHAEQLKGELTAVVSHEFRTPLAAISGFARTLTARLERFDQQTALTCARSIDRQTQRLTRLVTNLLAADGEVVVEQGAATQLRGAVEEVATQVLDYAPASTRLLRLDVPAGLSVEMGRDAVERVVLNLVDNALKFARPNTEVIVRARGEGGEVALQVSNVGEGVPPSERERIFAPFTQLDSSDSRRFGGLGLGLHVVRTVVEAHGGTVEVGQDGDRVVFTAHLPRAACAAVDVASAVPQVRLVRLEDPETLTPR